MENRAKLNKNEKGKKKTQRMGGGFQEKTKIE